MSSLSLARKELVALSPAAISSVERADRVAATTPSDALRVLHLINRYRFFGGEEAAVNRMTAAIRESGATVDECYFASED